MRIRRIAAATAVALVAALGMVVPGNVLAGTVGAAQAATASGTIVFIKGYNVWIARGDGTGQVKITSDGNASSPYQEPSMSDNGRIAVMKGTSIRVMNQSGKVLQTMTPAGLFIDGGGTTISVTPIGAPTISPDGKRIAYTQYRTVNYGAGIKVEALTGLSNVAPGSGDLVGGLVIGSDPSWLTNSRIVFTVSGPIRLHDWGSDAEPSNWFDDEILDLGDFEWADLSDPVLSPDGSQVVFLGQGADLLMLASVTGNPRTSLPPPPTFECVSSEATPAPAPYLRNYDRPSFGPANDEVVYEQHGNVFKLVNFSACNATTTTKRIIAGGSDPDWSRATYNPGSGGSDAKALKLKKTPTIKGAAKVGKTLKASAGKWSVAPKTVTFRWLRNGKAIKGAKGAKAKYKVTKADRGKKLSVRVTAKRPGLNQGKATSKSVKVKK